MKRLPRLALWLFAIAYLLPGFIGREGWKSADITAFGYMAELASGNSDWWRPTLMGRPLDNPALLPYWLGAWFVQAAPTWLAPDFAVRIPFALMLALAMLSTWFGTYYLARSPGAQPVAFAFGGEASPKDYARALGDGGLLALIASLGLAQLSHEATPELVQLGFIGILFYSVSAINYRRRTAGVGFVVGVLGLSLSGAPAIAAMCALASAAVHALDRSNDAEVPGQVHQSAGIDSAAMVITTLAVVWLGVRWGLWRWKVEWPGASWEAWNGFVQMLVWFTWPAWPLAGWTAWRWRRQLFARHASRHLLLPLCFVTVTVLASLACGSSDRVLLLALPPLAAMAAFALPTLQRQVGALVDWFTLLFFSGCGAVIWVVWVAMQTGFPRQPAANVARLAPGFEASLSPLAIAIAALATVAWAWLVQWRVGRHRSAIWKSLVLPASGAAWCWLLLMTLWMPLLNYAQSFNGLVRRTLEQLDPPGCVETVELSLAKVAALQIYGKLQLRPSYRTPACPWLIAEPRADMSAPPSVEPALWVLMASINHPTDGNERVMLFRRR